MNIYQKLQACRVELQKLNLKKSGENKFARFKYFELADFLPAINELFHKYGLFDRFQINKETATLSIIDTDTEAEPIIFSMPTASADLKGGTPIQSLGAQITYLRRYLYMNALDIVENDELDSVIGQTDKTVPKTKQTKPVSKAQQEEPQKKEPDLTVPEQDLDIHKGICQVGNMEELKIYYDELKEHVLNKQAFNVAITKRKHELNKELQND